MSGFLQLTSDGEFENLPLAYLKVFEASEEDEIRSEKVCEECKIVFEFELPLNFMHDTELGPNFYAIKGINEQYFGFYFERAADKEAFVHKMSHL